MSVAFVSLKSLTFFNVVIFFIEKIRSDLMLKTTEVVCIQRLSWFILLLFLRFAS